jgi:hypothetical protein
LYVGLYQLRVVASVRQHLIDSPDVRLQAVRGQLKANIGELAQRTFSASLQRIRSRAPSAYEGHTILLGRSIAVADFVVVRVFRPLFFSLQ